MKSNGVMMFVLIAAGCLLSNGTAIAGAGGSKPAEPQMVILRVDVDAANDLITIEGRSFGVAARGSGFGSLIQLPR